jgi:hypothetical protein
MVVWSPQLIASFVFGVAFVIALLALAIKYPEPTAFQHAVFRTVLALSAAGVAAVLPGLLNVEITAAKSLLLRGGGALGVFAVVYFLNPARLIATTQTSNNLPTPPTPSLLRDGTPTPDELKPVFFEVWQALVEVSKAGRDLWNKVSEDTIVGFAEALRAAHTHVGENALFFAEDDFGNLLDALDAANFYVGGKESLHRLRRAHMSQRSPMRRQEIQDRIFRQVAENKQWLARYNTMLREIHARMRQGLARVPAA